MTTQLNPISLPLAQNNVIEASAGTGKTYTMVTLYLRLLLQAGENNFPVPLDIEQILVVTFTRDATKELRQRINQRIQSWLKLLQQYQQHHDQAQIDDPELLNLLPYLEQNLDLAIQRLTFATQNIDRAAIFTIHGFCQRILQQYAFDSGLPFNFSAGEVNRAQLRQINYQFWREQFYALNDVQAQIITDIFQSPDQIFDQYTLLLSGDMPHLANALPFTDLHAGLQYYQAQIEKFIEIEAHSFAEFQQWLIQYQTHLQKKSLEKAQKYCASARNSEVIQRIQQAQDLLTLKFLKNKDVPLPNFLLQLTDFFAHYSAEAFKMAMHYVYVRGLRTQIFAYQDQHNEKNFDDLLRLLRDALIKPQAGKLIELIRQQYPFAMIDEFQDTDPIQLTIFAKIYLTASSSNIQTGFTVIGDPKQAIYRFRGADIFTYLSIMDRQQAYYIEHVFTLQHNYRSSTGLIDSLNRLFTQTNNPFYLSNIQFPLINAHRQGYLSIESTPQKAWHMLQLTREIKNKAPYQVAIAEMFACHIQQLLKGAAQKRTLLIEDPENQLQRPVEAKDIAILVRNESESQIIRQALANKGIISVYLSEKSNVFDSTIARDLCLILQACFNPFNEKTILSALGSTLWGLTAETIYQLKADETQWAELTERLLNYRYIWQTQGVLPMLYRLYQQEEIPQRLQQFTQGERYLVDLLHLTELLQNAMNQQQNEEALLNWYQQQLKGGIQGNEENRLRLEREQDVVKILTIHKSKGLEFPLVCLPFILTKNTQRNGKYEFYHDAEHRLIWDLYKTNTAAATLENNAENMRLLYVALTRAKYQLIVGLPAAPMFTAKTTLDSVNALDYLLLQGNKEKLSATMSYTELFDQALSAENWQVTTDQELPYTDNWQPNLVMQTELTVQDFNQTIEKNWQVTSFSALQSHLHNLYTNYFSDLGQDHEDRDFSITEEAYEDGRMPNSQGDYPVGYSPFDFPKGVEVGACLHSYLEKLDFSKPIQIDTLKPICQYLNLTDDWLLPLQQWFTQIMQYPLPELGSLAQITPENRLTELQFYLKLGKLFNSQAFNQILSQYHSLYDQQYPIQIDEIQGFIRGFIDAVVRHNGRYYVIDYKSNFIGNQQMDYQPEYLQNVMAAQRYDLQYLIYTLAVHRYLKHRDPDYQYESHFGGVFYLFLRGMSFPETQTAGVFFTKPSTTLIEKLDQLWGE